MSRIGDVEPDRCPFCYGDISLRWFNAGAQAGEYECPECKAGLMAVTTDNGWQARVSFELVAWPPEPPEDQHGS